MKKRELLAQDVTAINKKFYDQIAVIYDQVDSRRSSNLDCRWLEHLLSRIITLLSRNFPHCRDFSFLDAGAGTGFLAKQAKKYFAGVTLLDVSAKMLQKIDIDAAGKIVANCLEMPFADQSFHAVGAFATLHHLFAPQDFFKEAYRVLKTGGVIYCDHDIEAAFVRNFRIPLQCYRHFFDHGPKYICHCPEAALADYQISEWHGNNGICGLQAAKQLREIGFRRIELTFHWNGMGFPEKFLDMIKLKTLFSRRRLAPNLRLIAIK